MATRSGWSILRTVAAICALLIALPASFAQTPADPPSENPDMQQAAPLLSPDQLDNLVAPIALYPDPLLSQVLAASTYPLEIVEAQQWLGQNSDLQGVQLMDAAKGQNWDPSVQALVAFPDALELLASDVRWTTDLGDAFLAQQADVMSAVQRMRLRAKANGKLNSTPQQVVTTDDQDGQSAIEIQPADPQVIYVPMYSPTYVWGEPVGGGYYDMWYPADFGFGFGFGPGIYMSSYYPGWGGWGGWGWGCGWFGQGLYLNTGFFPRYGFRGGYHGGFGGHGHGGRVGWQHNPGHRMRIPYPNRAVARQFNSNRFSSGRSGGARMNSGQFTGSARGFTRSGNSGFRSGNRGYTGSGRQASPAYGAGVRSQGYRSAPSYNRSFGRSYSSPRSYSTPRQSYSAPRSYSSPRQSYSAPRSTPRRDPTPRRASPAEVRDSPVDAPAETPASLGADRVPSAVAAAEAADTAGNRPICHLLRRLKPAR